MQSLRVQVQLPGDSSESPKAHLNQWPLFKFLDFLFENEVLGYDGGILIRKLSIVKYFECHNPEIRFMDPVSKTGLLKVSLPMIKVVTIVTKLTSLILLIDLL